MCACGKKSLPNSQWMEGCGVTYGTFNVYRVTELIFFLDFEMIIKEFSEKVINHFQVFRRFV